MTSTALGDLTFDLRIDGPDDGEPIMLLHGFPETSQSWRDVTPRLVEQGYRVIAPDQRGYSPGARPPEVADYTVPLLAADVIGIAANLGYNNFHLVGHDWGAAVAWYLAAHHPARVRTLTAVSVPHLAAYGWALQHDADQQSRAAYIGLLREEGKAEEVLMADDAAKLRAMYGTSVPPDQIETYLDHLRQPGALTPALNWYRAMGADLSDLPAVTVPTTYVWSDDDLALGRAGAERCGEYVDADYRFVELAGLSHWLPEEAPDVLAEAITDRANSQD